MATQSATTGSNGYAFHAGTVSVPQGLTVLLGRFLFALIFVMAGPNHFSQQSIDHAASRGVPLAPLTVPLLGGIAVIAGMSILLGYHARIGAWLVVLFLVPVTLLMHMFWVVSDPTAAHVQMIMFMKNLTILGGALLITQFGAGPFSLDARREREAIVRLNPPGLNAQREREAAVNLNASNN